MNDQFDELTKVLAQSVTRRRELKKFRFGLAALALASLVAGQAHAADFYADASVSVNGDGSAARPYWRITDAVERARLLRQAGALPLSERIVIHAAPGAYFGSQENPVLNKNPRYEVLPILLNVPNLTLAGSTILTTDGGGLPTGALPGTEALLVSVDYTGVYTEAVILISRTTDGSIGNDVTVTGLHVDNAVGGGYGPAILVDRVSGFRIQRNFITGTYNGITTQSASGTIEGNLALVGGPGAYVTGGSAAFPASLVITRNRTVDGEGGLMLTAVSANYSAQAGANDLQIVPQSATFDSNELTNTLLPTVVSNDFSRNRGFGMRLDCLPAPVGNGGVHFDSKQGIHGAMAALVRDNSVNDNGHYGISVDAHGARRTSKRPDSFSFGGTFQGNQVTGNGQAGFLFSFTAIWVAVENSPPEDSLALTYYKYLQDSTYDVSVLDGEAAGFDYDNPILDPFDGTVLNNTLRVNGSLIPPGTKITAPGP